MEIKEYRERICDLIPEAADSMISPEDFQEKLENILEEVYQEGYDQNEFEQQRLEQLSADIDWQKA